MADVDGSYECTVKSPLGEQKTTLTVKADGASFTGTNSGAMGAADISGTVDGSTIAWQQQISVPMAMTLDCEATIEGDSLTGTVGAGAFGKFPMTGTRV